VLPITLLASLILGSIAAPILPRFAGPLAIAQARKPQTPEDTITETPPKLVRSKTTTGASTRRRKERPAPLKQSLSSPNTPPLHTPTQGSPLATPDATSPKKTKPDSRPFPLERRNSANDLLSPTDLPLASPSLPDLRMNRHSMHNPLGAASSSSASGSSASRRPRKDKILTPTLLSSTKKIHMLRANYFRREEQFLSALDKISNKLVQVPKPARLSALRAELALLNNDLPSEVDIPVICPATVHQTQNRTSHHRIVRINPAEATVLNSAERVPYLLMVEILRDDFDFDPERPENVRLLTDLLQEEASGNTRRTFDLSEAPRTSSRKDLEDEGPSSVFEPSAGDIGTSPMIGMGEEFGEALHGGESSSTAAAMWPRPSSGANSMSTNASRGGTPRSSDPTRSDSPSPRKSGRPNGEAPDLSALATHMRTAANMLAQLEASGNKRPKSEVAAIKAKIIASMQTLEEQSFFFEETAPLPTFDTIMANTASNPLPVFGDRDDEVEGAKPAKNINAEAGAARMENDQMTSGVERKADRDDPSAATFGEEWTAKRERVRKSSPYGMCQNWDLLSVIVKTGADLRQEAFACQLIHVCGKIWADAEVPVWIKRMRILVTGEVGFVTVS
jgi:hypothetical protein